MKFNNEDEFRAWKLAYHSTFDTPSGQEVLTDLAKFCYAMDDAFDPDARVHAAREGRRQVFLRIVKNLNLNLDEIFQVYRGRRIVMPATSLQEE